MPKLYVKNYHPNAIKKRLSSLHDHYVSTKIRKTMYSPEGIFSVRNDKVVKLVPRDFPVEDMDDYLLDNSFYSETDILSQIPVNSVYTETTELHFCVGKKSNVHFVVEGNYDKQSLVDGTCGFGSDKYEHFNPTDFYFETRENLNNELVLKEVNMILSII
uniref:Uncharacterized protein n=1 Tax=viral metagenome TaxID=1070528 RepID=A0A6C0FDG8_9ZZZZ